MGFEEEMKLASSEDRGDIWVRMLRRRLCALKGDKTKEMRILVNIGHPAHVHFFKYMIKNLEKERTYSKYYGER